MQHFSLELFRKDDTSFELRILKDQSLQVTHKVEQSEVDALQAATSLDYKITAPDLVQRGEQLFNWVDQHTNGWLRGTRQQPHAMALTIEVSEAGLRHLPWELLHDGTDFLCAHPLHLFTPLRRVTTAERKQSWQPQKRQLGILFMASSPENTKPVLDFEAEESGILQATAKKPLDLQVEESGSLAGLQERLSEYEESPDILHLSGHADIIEDSMQPVFLLEDELGQCEPVTPLALARTLLEANAKPRLIFLSGCRTGESSHQHGMLSFSEQMVDAGVPAVLGWALPVGDQAASKAATILYEKLATGFEIAQAVALTRQQLLEDHSPYWHLLRVYVDGSTLNPLVAKGKLRHRPHNTPQQFLDAGGRVPVCARTEFIGRRRLLQRSLRSLRTWYGEEAYAEGVLLYGMGGLGKSSTAARLVDRLQNSHQAVVCYGGLDETVLLTALGKALPKAQNLLNDAEQTLENRLRTLFEPEDNPYSTKPLLLVFDDFEQNIPKALRQQGQINYNPDSLQVLHSVLQAIHESHSDTRVVVTSRFDVPVPKPCCLHKENPQTLHGSDLNKKLAQLTSLRPPSRSSTVQETEDSLRLQAITIAAGNPRLLEWLDIILQEKHGDLPIAELFIKLATEEDRFREDVLIEALLDAQTRSVRRTLACAALYRLPVQLEAIEVLDASNETYKSLQTLAKVGLVEATKNIDGELYFVSNLLDTLLAGTLSDVEVQRLSAEAAHHLYEKYHYKSPEKWTLEIVRLAVAGKAQMLAVYAGNRLAAKMLYDNRYCEAEYLCQQILTLGEDFRILSTLAKTKLRLGAGEAANDHIERAVALLPADKTTLSDSMAFTMGAYADILEARGKLDDALDIRQNDELPVYEKLGDVLSKAVTMGKIADILQARGQLDDALNIRQNEELPVYEKHGDLRSKANTMGKIADILQARGQLDEALSIRQTEQLPVYEKLDDIRAKAITMGYIADILQARGQLDEALNIRQNDVLPIFEKLGDVREKALATGKIADTLWQQDPEKHAETIRDYLNKALAYFQNMQLPSEIKWIEGLFSDTGLPRQGAINPKLFLTLNTGDVLYPKQYEPLFKPEIDDAQREQADLHRIDIPYYSGKKQVTLWTGFTLAANKNTVEVNAREFLDLLITSVSLDAEIEKNQVISSFSNLSQQQIDGATKMFTEEQDKFIELGKEQPEYTDRLQDKMVRGWLIWEESQAPADQTQPLTLPTDKQSPL